MTSRGKAWLAFALLGCAVVPALAVSAQAGEGDTALADAELASMEAQLQVGEFAAVAERAERLTARIEAQRGRYDAALAKPLTLLGDARMGGGDADGALQAYDRAKHIVRIADGLQGVAQLHLLYREANALVELGDRQGANERHELAYSLKLRQHGAEDARLLPALYRLANWYRHNYKFRASQLLYEQIISIGKRSYPPGDHRIADALRQYAASLKERRFGTRLAGRGGFSAWPPGHPPDPPWYGKSPFRRGRAVRREILALTQATPNATDAEVATAVVELADWHLLHYEYGLAMGYYRRAWNLLKSDAHARAEIFEEPTPLYLRLPRNPARASSRQGPPRDGVVRLALNVTHRGDVVGRRTLLAEPYNIMEFRVRKAAKRARYRPAFRAGNPVPRRNLQLEFKYQYHLGDATLSR